MAERVTIICGTHRHENFTSVIARHYETLLKSKHRKTVYFTLEQLPLDYVFNNDIFGKKNPGYSAMVKEYIINSDAFVFLAPEYNGSIPGSLKAFIDGVEPSCFAGKKAALVGVASGRSGNVRGLDHLTNILNYIGVNVLPYKVLVSRVMNVISDGKIIHEETMETLEKQVEKFISF